MGSRSLQLTVICIISLAYLHEVQGVADSTETISVNVHSHNIDILRGRDGRDGLQGEKGDKGEPGPPGPRGPSGGGLIFTRWGKKSCPDTDQTELIYEGLMTGGSHNDSGGGANYICMSKLPEYLSNRATPYFSSLQSAKYKNTVSSENIENQAAACAVCYTSIRSAKLMIPGKRTCPFSWTKEYSGYLMSDFFDHKHNSVYECIDENMEKSASNTSTDSPSSTSGKDRSARLYHVATDSCTDDLPCPQFKKYVPITCVICTR